MVNHNNSNSHHHGGGSSNTTKNEHAVKIALIQQVLDEPNVDLWKLRGLALSEGGLVNGKFAFICVCCYASAFGQQLEQSLTQFMLSC